MSTKKRIAIELIVSQIEDAMSLIRNALINELIEKNKEMSDDDFIDAHSGYTKNPFKTIIKLAKEISNEYESFLNRPEGKKLRKSIEEKLENDPNSFLDLVSQLREEFEISSSETKDWAEENELKNKNKIKLQ